MKGLKISDLKILMFHGKLLTFDLEINLSGVEKNDNTDDRFRDLNLHLDFCGTAL